MFFLVHLVFVLVVLVLVLESVMRIARMIARRHSVLLVHNRTSRVTHGGSHRLRHHRTARVTGNGSHRGRMVLRRCLHVYLTLGGTVLRLRGITRLRRVSLSRGHTRMGSIAWLSRVALSGGRLVALLRVTALGRGRRVGRTVALIRLLVSHLIWKSQVGRSA